MGQSTVIFGTLLFAFIVFITVRGELPKYMGFFFGKTIKKTTAPVSYGGMGSPLTGIAESLGSDLLSKVGSGLF